MTGWVSSKSSGLPENPVIHQIPVTDRLFPRELLSFSSKRFLIISRHLSDLRTDPFNEIKSLAVSAGTCQSGWIILLRRFSTPVSYARCDSKTLKIIQKMTHLKRNSNSNFKILLGICSLLKYIIGILPLLKSLI